MLAAPLLALALLTPASGYVSCEAMHVVSMESDCVVSATLRNVFRETYGDRVYAIGWLAVESAVFGASAGDTLLLEWDYAAPPQADGRWTIKSPADPDYGTREGLTSLWFLRHEGRKSCRTTSMHCSVFSFGASSDRVLRYLSGPPVIPKRAVLDWDADGWKAEAVREYLILRREEE